MAGGTQTAAAAVQYDANGDPIGVQSGFVPLPGDLWASIMSPLSDTDGVAPYLGGLLVSNGAGSITHIDELGNPIASFVTAETGDAWLGFDVSRDLVITTNATSDTMKGYTFGNSTPVFSVFLPTSGPVGAAWDSNRDEYVYCDWATDDIVVLDPTTLAVKRTFNFTGVLNRMAGIAYDCTDDVYVVGDRDLRTHTLINPMTGAVGLSYVTAGAGASNPRGAALSSDGGIWTGDFGINGMFLQEAGHGPTNGCSGTPWTSFCYGDGTDTACPCGNFGGAGEGCMNSAGTGATLTASGSVSASANDLVLSGSGLPPGVPSLFFAGTSTINPAASFGDGLRCAGGQIIRMEIVFVSAAGNASTTVGIASSIGATAGQSHTMQLWYRDPAGPCAAQFNTTGALGVTWQ